MSIKFDFFLNPNPNEKKASELSKFVNNRLETSLTHLLSEVERVLKLDTSKQRQICKASKSFEELNWSFYAFHDSLLTAMEKEDVPRIHNIVKEFPLFRETEAWSVNTEPKLYDITHKLFLQDEPNLLCSQSELDDQGKRAWEKALEVLEKFSPMFASESALLLRRVFLCNNKQFKGASSFRFLGSMFLALPEKDEQATQTFYFLEWLIHETAHIYLHCLLSEDPMVLNDPSERFESPLRLDPRPMIQVYHAVFVLFRLILLFREMISHPSLDSDLRKIAISKLEDYMNRWKTSEAFIKQNAKLTKAGARFFEEMQISIH